MINLDYYCNCCGYVEVDEKLNCNICGNCVEENQKMEKQEFNLETINKREYNDDHLTTQERKNVLDYFGYKYNETNLNEVFVNKIID